MEGQFRGISFAGATAPLLLLLACLVPSALRAAIPAGERQVLINLYNAANGGGWTHNSGWCASACPASGTPTFAAAGTECNWYGITCDAAASHVTAVGLASNNLSGTLPDLSGLANLQYFSVVSNKLAGSIPALSSLAQLRVFYADNNALTGSIPSLAASTQLREFSVAFNALSGPIPSLTGLANLNTFLVTGNRLSGSLPSLSGLGALQDFEVGNNLLSGSIPSLPTGLLRLFAEHNQLTGSIPSLSAAGGLLQINLGANRLTGSVPAAPANLYTPLPWAPSSLCANPLNLASSANDAGWNAATGFTPWWATPHAGNQCDEIMSGAFE
jgi:hypothetical protein